MTAAALLTACGDFGLTAVDSDGTRVPLLIVTQVVLPNPTTFASVEAASIHGDTLRVHVSYAGGCGKHEFGLSAERGLLDSTPPQVVMVLRHDGHGDPCRARLEADLEADLRPLQALVGAGRTVRVRLYEPQASTPIDAPLEYTF